MEGGEGQEGTNLHLGLKAPASMGGISRRLQLHGMAVETMVSKLPSQRTLYRAPPKA